MNDFDSPHKNKSNTHSFRMPDISLLGRKVHFKKYSETGGGNLRGVVNDIYEGGFRVRST